MVVVSIISLLSSVTLVSLNSARDKADTAYRIRTMEEYVKGVTLYRENTGAYPWGYPAFGYVCMASTNCGAIPPGATFNALIDPYVKLQPAFKTLADPSGNLYGPYYFCASVNPTNSCAQAYITWSQKGIHQPCNILGVTSTEILSIYSTLTICKANFDNL